LLSSERLLIHDIPVELRPNKRRRTRLGMTIDPGGFLVLDVPLNVSMADVEAVVTEHQRWLRHRLSEVQKTQSQSSQLSYQSGELVYVQGAALTLDVRAGLFESIVQTQTQLIVTTPQTDAMMVRNLLTGWYSQEAAVLFGSVLASYQDLPWLQGKCPPWRHRYMRSQWGSCSAKGRLSLNTHLVKTPKRLVEYVVLHELCHLKHHNHGQAFHELVAHHMPDWRARSTQLEKYLPILLQV